MRSLISVVTMVLLVVSGGCGGVLGGGSLENEAAKRAKEHWRLTEIGGASYLCEVRGTVIEAQKNESRTEWGSAVVFELRNPKVEVTRSSLTEAEKLNGVEWRGSVYMKVDAFRRCPPESFGGPTPTRTWSAWLSDNPSSLVLMLKKASGHYTDEMRVEKINGEWKVSPCNPNWAAIGGEPWHAKFKQVEPSDLPK